MFGRKTLLYYQIMLFLKRDKSNQVQILHMIRIYSGQLSFDIYQNTPN